jgi:hypothetical protein
MPLAAAIGAAGFVLLLMLPVGWTILARALPLVTAAVFVPLVWREVRRSSAPAPDRSTDRVPHRRTGLLLWTVFAGALLGKVLLHVRFGHYGFALAMPATVLLAVALTSLLPGVLEDRYERGTVARALGLAAVGACIVWCLGASNSHYAIKTLDVGSGKDRILAEEPPYGRRALIIAEGLERLEELLPEDATLLVWPEGVVLNYWLRHRNPSRFNLFLPSELSAFGAGAMLADVERSPPDWLVLLHRDPTDFGAGRFGQSEATGQGFVTFFERDYERVETIGAEPFRSRAPGLVILRHKSL